MKNQKDLSEDEIEKLRKITHWSIEDGDKFDPISKGKRDINEAVELYFTSKEDLESANILKENQKFAQCTFYLQQSVEKLGKSILIVMGLCKTKDLKNKVGHAFTKFTLNKFMILYGSFMNFNITGFEKAFNLIRDFKQGFNKKQKKDALNMNYDKLKEVLMLFDYIHETIVKNTKTHIRSAISRISQIGIKQISRVILEESERITGNKLDYESKEKKIKEYEKKYPHKEIIKVIANYNLTMLLLFYLVILSINLEIHVSESRYPSKNGFQYDKNQEIVKLSPLISTTIAKLLALYRFFLETNNFIKKDSSV